MISRPYYNILDAIQAPARGLSAKQILVMTSALVAGLVVYDVFRYLAFVEQGENIGLVFDLYGFFPFVVPPSSRVLAGLLFGCGLLGGVLCVMLGFLAVSIMHVEAIRGNAFLSARQSFRFVRSRVRQVIAAEAAIVVFVGLIVLLFALFGLIARIPVFGDLVFGVFFVIPNFIIAFFTVFILFVMSLSVVLLPAVAATTRTGESFGVLLETFSTIIRQPTRWFGYTAITAVLGKIASFVYAYFAFRAIQFMVLAASLGGGRKIGRLVSSGLSYLPIDGRLVSHLFNVFPGVKWSFDLKPLMGPTDSGIAAHLVSLMLCLIFATIVGYFLATIAAGQVYTYVGLRKLRGGADLSLEKPLLADTMVDQGSDPQMGRDR